MKPPKRKPKVRSAKLRPIPKIKEDVWTLCSQYNRQKDADWRGYVKCVTCPAFGHWKSMQGGHFLAGRTKAILFDDRGIHAQCYGCNVMKHGNQYEYYLYMKNRYGQRIVDALYKKKSQQGGPWTRPELERHKKRYIKLLKTVGKKEVFFS